MDTKICNTCKIEKPRNIEYYGKDKRNPDGYVGRCRVCSNKRVAEMRAERAKIPKIIPENKKCSGCKEVKSSEKFDKNRVFKDGLADYCKQCKKEHAYKYGKKGYSKYNLKRREKNEGVYKVECLRCNTEKTNLDFDLKSSSKSGLSYFCRDCNKTKPKLTYTEKYEILGDSRIPDEKYCPKCETTKTKDLFYSVKGRSDGLSDCCKKCDSARRNRKRNTCPITRLRTRYSNQLRYFFDSRGVSKNSKSADVIGCTWEEFAAHIEAQFEDGMNWENRDEWDIDHIVPLSQGETEDEIKYLSHYTNFQPLWSHYNQHIKTNKIGTAFGNQPQYEKFLEFKNTIHNK